MADGTDPIEGETPSERHSRLRKQKRARSSRKDQSAQKSWRATNPDKAREYARQYREANRDHLADVNRAWRAANLERSRKINRLSAKRQAERRSRQEQKRKAGRAWYREHRDQQLERSRRFRREHPEKVREYQRRWKDKDPERARELGRNWTQAHRDRNGDQHRALGRAAASARRERDPDAYKRWYEENLEAQRARGREASQLRSRLKKLGLPARKIQRTYAEQKRANARAADDYFARKRTASEIRRLSKPDSGSRDRALAADLAQHGIEERHAEDRFLVRLPELIKTHRERYGERIIQDVTMDNVARIARGKTPYDVEHESNQRLLRELVSREAPMLDPERIVQLSRVIRNAKSVPPETATGNQTADSSPSTPTSVNNIPDDLEWVSPHTRAGIEIPGFYRQRRKPR